jgi:hypothetical protein
VHIDEDILPDLARITGSSLEIFLNRNGRFSPEPSMVISLEDFEKAAVKGSIIGSRWPYLVKKYGLPSRRPLPRNRADDPVIPRILSGPTFLEDISDTIDFELKWRNENIPDPRIVGFAADDLDGDDVPEIAIMYWVEGDENGERLQVYKNYGEGNWQLAFDSTAMGLKSCGMVAHDFDGDDHAEVIWIHRDDSKVQVFNTMGDYWIGNCNLYGYLNQDYRVPPSFSIPRASNIPGCSIIIVITSPKSARNVGRPGST